MKKVFIVIMCCLTCALYGVAQETLPAPQPTSIMLARAGDTYYLGNEKMNKTQTMKWLKEQNCLVAYDLFHSGLVTSRVGWVMLAAGLLIDGAGAIYMSTSVDKGSVKGLITGWTVCGLGAALELAAVPTISVGYLKMHQSVGAYNTYCHSSARTRPYWAIQASQNGIGLAYKF